MLERNSPQYWIFTIVFLAALVGAMYLYITTFYYRVEPRIRESVGARYGVVIEYRVLTHWSIAGDSWRAYEGNRTWLLIAVHGTHFVMMMTFVVLMLAMLGGFGYVAYLVAR